MFTIKSLSLRTRAFLSSTLCIRRGIFVMLCLLSCGDLNGQVLVGVKAGFHIPGAQDLKFKWFDSALLLRETIHTNRVTSNITSFNGMDVTIYGKDGFWKNKGVRLEYAAWEFDSRSRGFFVPNPPPIDRAEQHRMALMASFIRKFDCPSFLKFIDQSKSFTYVGIGGGAVLTDVDPGKYEWNLGFQILSGISTPLSDRLRGTMEIKYLITHDADNNTAAKPGWFIDTSGTAAWLRLGPHLDTRFITLQVGLQWAVVL